MTEAEWLNSTDPTPMLKLLKGKASERKLRLFAIACFRPFSHFCTDVRSQNAIRTSEKYADGLVDLYELINSHLYATDIPDSLPAPAPDTYPFADDAAYFAAQLARPTRMFRDGELDVDPIDIPHLISQISYLSAHSKNNFHVGISFDRENLEQGEAIEKERQCRFCRDIFGTPFSPVDLDPTWLTSDVVTLAEGVYANRAFDRLPILADALQDAGCENDEVLTHCRSEGPHVRGCWVIDLLLEKE